MQRSESGSNADRGSRPDRLASDQDIVGRNGNAHEVQTNYCRLCSFKQPYPRELREVFHNHFSSKRLRIDILGVEATGRGFYCISCKSRHRPNIDDRINIVVSDSTLHQFYAPLNSSGPLYEGDLVHVDYVTIEGGLIPDLLQAFCQDYRDDGLLEKPIDVVLVAGYQDVRKGYARDYILRGMMELGNIVLSLKNRTSPEKKNSFAVASMMYPPALCWFRDNGPQPHNYTNMKEKIDWLNGKIHELNLSNGVEGYPSFHTYGMRVGSENVVDNDGRRRKVRTKSHRWEHWKEAAKRDKLHLREDRRFKLGKAVNNYFVYRT